MSKPVPQRWKVLVDGKWTGSSYASKKDAEAKAESYRASPSQKIEVVPKK